MTGMETKASTGSSRGVASGIVGANRMEKKASIRAYGRKRAKKVTIHDVWATINEVAKAHKETEAAHKETERGLQELRETAKETVKGMQELKDAQAETDRLMKENAAETDRRFRETDRIVKENSRQMGDVHNRLGELVEHIVLPNIMEKVKPLGLGFEHIRPRYEFTDKDFRPVAEADVLLINGKYLMVIEVKTVLKVKDVDNHVKRLETIRRHACAPYGSRSFLGAVAGAVVDGAVKTYAHRKGLYVAEQSGDTLRLDVPDGFTPMVW